MFESLFSINKNVVVLYTVGGNQVVSNVRLQARVYVNIQSIRLSEYKGYTWSVDVRRFPGLDKQK